MTARKQPPPAIHLSKRLQAGYNPGEDWNTLLQNAAHSGGINNSQIKLPLQLQWTANTGSNIFMASPIIAGQKVFIATTDDNIP